MKFCGPILLLLLLLGMVSCSVPQDTQFEVRAINLKGLPIPCDVYVDSKKVENPQRSELEQSVTIAVSFVGKKQVTIKVVPTEKNSSGQVHYFPPQSRRLTPNEARKQLFAAESNPNF
jgi:hypothetical protein